MIRLLKIILLILGSVILQSTIVAKLSMFGSKPDLPLALTVSFALLNGSLQGELVGFTSGLLCDLSSGGPFLGIQSLSKVIIGYLIGFMRYRFYSDSVVTQLISGFAASLADKFITALHLNFLLSGLPFPRIHIAGLLLTALINSILVVITFRILRKFLKSEVRTDVWHR